MLFFINQACALYIAFDKFCISVTSYSSCKIFVHYISNW